MNVANKCLAKKSYYQNKPFSAENRESLLKTIVDIISSDLSIEEIKKSVVTEVGKAFGCNRCFLRIFEKNIDDFSPVDKFSEYLSSSEELSLVDYKFNDDLNDLAISVYKQGIGFIIPDIDVFLKNENVNESISYTLRDYFQVKSNYCFPVVKNNDLIGAFVVHYTQQKVELASVEIELLKTIAKQVVIIIKQYQLIKEKERQIEREILLKNITNIIGSSLDIKEVKTLLVNSTGKHFDVNRCFIRQIHSGKKVTRIDEYSEYRSHSNVKSIVGISGEIPKHKFWINTTIREEVIMPNSEEYVKELNLQGTPAEQHLLENNIKSAYAFPIRYEEELLGIYACHYTEEIKKLNEEDLNLLRMIADQAGIAMYKAMLYEKMKQQAEREKFLAKLMSVVKSSLNLEEIVSVVSHEIKNFYNLQAVQIRKCSKNTCSMLYSENISQYTLYNKCLFDGTEKCELEDCKGIFTGEVEFFPDIVKQRIKFSNVSQLIGIPVMKGSVKIATLCLFSEKVRNWDEDDIKFLENIADNIFIAIRDSNIYTQNQFVSNVSHELRTPITVIKGYAEALVNQKKSNPAFLNAIKNHADRIEDIINNLLCMSKIEQEFDNTEIIFENASLKDVIENSIITCDQEAKTRNIEIVFKQNNDICINANKVLLHQAIVNLIKNAINYSEEKTVVEINTKENEHEILIEVKDQGYGIPNEYLETIFERFYRIDKSRNRSTGGSGLGLSIVKLICQIHGGNVSVKSETDRGSVFTIHLPTRIHT